MTLLKTTLGEGSAITVDSYPTIVQLADTLLINNT